jgi:hypothetical protein
MLDLMHMPETAESQEQPLMTDESRLPDGLYDLCALAFGTTRDDGRQHLMAAAYAKPGKVIS